MWPGGRTLFCVAFLGLQLLQDTGANPRARNTSSSVGGNAGAPLFLTEYIQGGRIREGQNRSEVPLFKRLAGVKAHSGYITVNASMGSNLFFLYLKAAKDPRGDAPLILWLQGGPGKSSLCGQFLEGGPLGIAADGRLYRRKLTLQEKANIVYLEQPVGSGYSFTRDPRGFARTLDDIADSIEEFLRQFLLLFPENTNRRFYVFGESYGARSAVGIVNRLQTNHKLPLNVSGAILGVPFLGPLLKLFDSSDYLYNTGLLDEEGRQAFAQRFQQIEQAAKVNRTLAAGLLLRTVFNANVEGEPSLYEQLTGYTDHNSALRTKAEPETIKYKEYVTSDAFKKAVHVGLEAQLEAQRLPLFLSLAQSDYFDDVSDTLARVLDSVRVLYYTGQLDTVFPAVNIDRYLKKLKWSGQGELARSERKPWFSASNATTQLGYVTRARNLTYALVLRAGHLASFDQPAALFDLVYNFIHKKKPAV
ncbi:venom serine carboxypeptidase-like [Haemaphysalis longicornis]